MYNDLIAPEARIGHAEAAERLRQILQTPVEVQQQRIQQILEVGIVDKLVLPAVMKFHPVPKEGRINMSYQLVATKAAPSAQLQIHRHALKQLADYADLPFGSFVSRLLGPWEPDNAWRSELLAHNFNTIFTLTKFEDRKGHPIKLLHRLVGNELRGVLSRKYNRKLNTANLLRPFLETAHEFQANVASVRHSDIKSAVTCLLPFIFEPLDGEFVAIGATFSNSDFGAGRTRVSGMCLRLKTGSASVLEDTLAKVHLGSIIQESDLELSAETEDKELSAHQSAVRDTVRAVLDPKAVQRVLTMIQLAQEHKLPWHLLRKRLQAVLQKSEVELIERLLTGTAEEVVDLPPIVNQEATAWWASSALGWLANQQKDTEHRLDIQNLAGKIISGVS